MLKKYFVLVLAVVVFFCFVFPVSASVLVDQNEVESEVVTELTGFIPEGYKYYICQQWERNGDYYIGFFKSFPVMTHDLYREGLSSYYFYHVYASDSSNPLYYRFDSYDDMIGYLITNDSNSFEFVYEVNDTSYMRINSTSDKMFFCNFDFVFDDGELYFSRNPYVKVNTELVPSEDSFFVGLFTSDDLLSLTLSEVLSVLPVAIVVLVGFIGIRKGILFISNKVRSC